MKRIVDHELHRHVLVIVLGDVTEPIGDRFETDALRRPGLVLGVRRADDLGELRPTTAVAATSAGLLTWKRKRATRLANAMRTVSQSPIAMRERSRLAPSIVPIAAA